MNKKNPRPKKSSLEGEVITATIILYLFLVGVMAFVHHMQPTGQQTMTSSSSPSHDEFSAPAETRKPSGTETGVHAKP